MLHTKRQQQWSQISSRINNKAHQTMAQKLLNKGRTKPKFIPGLIDLQESERPVTHQNRCKQSLEHQFADIWDDQHGSLTLESVDQLSDRGREDLTTLERRTFSNAHARVNFYSSLRNAGYIWTK